MSELVERQAAIDAHCELCGDRWRCNGDICPDVEVFQLLPSVHPEIIRCKDCKFSDEFDGDVWLCRRRKESFRVLAIDTCNVAKRRTDE